MKNAQTAHYGPIGGTLAGESRSTLLAKAKEAIAAAIGKIKSEGAVRQAMWELEQLDDHALRDIGLNRCDIEARVRGYRL